MAPTLLLLFNQVTTPVVPTLVTPQKSAECPEEMICSTDGVRRCVGWKIYNKAYVAAVTVCAQRLFDEQ